MNVQNKIWKLKKSLDARTSRQRRNRIKQNERNKREREEVNFALKRSQKYCDVKQWNMRSRQWIRNDVFCGSFVGKRWNNFMRASENQNKMVKILDVTRSNQCNVCGPKQVRQIPDRDKVTTRKKNYISVVLVPCEAIVIDEMRLIDPIDAPNTDERNSISKISWITVDVAHESKIMNRFSIELLTRIHQLFYTSMTNVLSPIEIDESMIRELRRGSSQQIIFRLLQQTPSS